MVLSGAVLWWEEWQLRILVLASVFVQWLLCFTASKRKLGVPSWLRSIMWLAYLGSDALAIYALATLFSRQRRQDCSSAHSNSILEVAWAPILLMHLGGQDTITAYNIEDNELWTRHVVTAVSQVTVAIYVFCKSWPGGDRGLLVASIWLFVPGILKCLEKPWALKSASINSLVSSSHFGPATSKKVESLEDYVQLARAIFVHLQAQGEGNPVDFQNDNLLEARRICNPGDFEACKLFVDFASPYPARLRLLKSLCVLDGKRAYAFLQSSLHGTFDRLYTKYTIRNKLKYTNTYKFTYTYKSVRILARDMAFTVMKMPNMLMTFSAIGLFHQSRIKDYNDNDVKVTYALLCCTALLELYAFLCCTAVRESFPYAWWKYFERFSRPIFPLMVSQYSLIGFFARNKRHTKKMCILSFFNCKEFLDQHWSMKSCDSSSDITELVLKHVKKGWLEQIENAKDYWKFNDRRGQWTLEDNGCDQALDWSLTGSFDKCVLLWHIATDFCFYYMSTSADHQCATAKCNQDDASGQGQGCGAWCERSPYHERAIQCRQISNYMVYLLFVNPEMLMAGTRRDLFMTANDEVEKILRNNESLEKILKAKKPGLKVMLKGAIARLKEIRRIKDLIPWVNAVRKDILKDENKWLWEIERGLMQQVIAKVQPTECTESPLDAKNTTQEGFVHDAWKLSRALLDLDDEKMWEVIQGVWVEMLCFSASRCRGYLHAKSLGTGGELLTYIWLLLSHMGMETLPERLQRTEVSSGGGNASAASSHPQASTTTGDDIV